MKEYAFDVSMFAVVRVEAETEAAAREAMMEVLDAAEVSDGFIHGYNDVAESVRVTEVSISTDESGPELFEIDGEMV